MASQKHAAPPHIRPDRTWGVLGRFSPWTSDEGREQQSVLPALEVSIRTTELPIARTDIHRSLGKPYCQSMDTPCPIGQGFVGAKVQAKFACLIRSLSLGENLLLRESAASRALAPGFI